MKSTRYITYFGNRIPDRVYEDYERAKDILDDFKNNSSDPTLLDKFKELLEEMNKKYNDMIKL
ncbi:MAG: hypothetical protein ACK4PR_11660 [Gammaproteobacteria bacterium]